MHKVVKLSIIYFVTAFFLIGTVRAQTTNYQVYSLFVLNFAKYASWPSQAGEFQITIIGKSKVYEELMKQAATKTVNGLVLKVNQIEDVTEIGRPQIIYISDGKSSTLNDVIKATQGKSVMIIAEREGFFKKGAGFSFVLMENNTLRFDINNSDLEKRQIRISKNLTELANSRI